MLLSPPNGKNLQTSNPRVTLSNQVAAGARIDGLTRHPLDFSLKPAPSVYGAVSYKGKYSNFPNERNWKWGRKVPQKETSAAKKRERQVKSFPKTARSPEQNILDIYF